MERAQQEAVREKIATFTQEIVAPAFEEMAATLERKGKGVTLYFDYSSVDDDAEDLFSIAHGGTGFPEDLARSFPDDATINQGNALYRGPSIVVEDPEATSDPVRLHRLFCVSLMFRLGSGARVYGFPLVTFYMRFNDKFHKFLHRFDNEIANHPIDEIDKYQIQNHFLNAFTFFRIYAGKDEKPPGF